MPRFKRSAPPEPFIAPIDEDVVIEEKPNPVPADWQLGALLNVRHGGDAYIVTLYPEEASFEHPERTLRFTNSGTCQDFVSRWYARESHDPRA